MASIYDWSLTASNNSTADSDLTWAEGQAPSTVNNSAREMMRKVRQFVTDLGGSLSAGGTANALTLTASSSFSTLVNGRIVAFRATEHNTDAATLNVNGIGSRAIRYQSGDSDAALSANMIRAGGIFVVRYSESAAGGSGGWILQNPVLGALFAPAAGSASITTVGALDSGSITSGFGDIDIGESTASAGILRLPHDDAPGSPTNGDIWTTTVGIFARISGATWSLLASNVGALLTTGYTATNVNDGTKSTGTYTPSPADGNYRRIVNGGAFTFAAPTADNDFDMVVKITNNASAGAVTFTGFDLVAGDDLTTTDEDVFFIDIRKLDGTIRANIQAMQE